MFWRTFLQLITQADITKKGFAKLTFPWVQGCSIFKG